MAALAAQVHGSQRIKKKNKAVSSDVRTCLWVFSKNHRRVRMYGYGEDGDIAGILQEKYVLICIHYFIFIDIVSQSDVMKLITC